MNTKITLLAIASMALVFAIIFGALAIVFYNRFGTINVFKVANGIYSVVGTDIGGVRISTDPTVFIAKPDPELLDKHMDTLGYERIGEEQPGRIIVYSDGTKEHRILYIQYKYYSLWKWKD